MPKYTVVMPARNAAKTISSAIQSVLISFPDDIHVVVWDDGSIDGTGEIASEFDAKKVSVITSSESVGGGAARQKIIASTDSEYIVNQDSDDISLPWRYKVQSNMLHDAEFVFTAMHRFSRSFRVHHPSLPLAYAPHDVPISLLMHNTLSHPTMIAKRTALEEIGGYSESRVAQDYELWLRAASKGKRLRRSGIPCLAYRLSEGQVSQQPDYRARILGSKTLLESYTELASMLLPQQKSPMLAITSGTRGQLIKPNDLRHLVSSMSWHLRPYYERLITSGRYGHLGAAAIG